MTAGSKVKIRKIATFVEETRTEMGRTIDPPTRRAAAVAVIENPYAGKYAEDLTELMLIGEELGELLTLRAVAALGIPASSVESYGKAAAVGENGEIEHAAAILHPRLGAPVRKVLGKGAALIPSSKKRGGMGVGVEDRGQHGGDRQPERDHDDLPAGEVRDVVVEGVQRPQQGPRELALPDAPPAMLPRWLARSRSPTLSDPSLWDRRQKATG